MGEVEVSFGSEQRYSMGDFEAFLGKQCAVRYVNNDNSSTPVPRNDRDL